MHPRIEIVVATVLLITALCVGKVVIGSRLYAAPAPPPAVNVAIPAASPVAPQDPAPQDPAPGQDPQPGKQWTLSDANDGPVIQVAILLDTSGSMEGLIDQTRTQLWRIVNEFGRAERKGSKPQLQVALYEYGKSTLSAQQGYVRMIAPFTTDLDGLSEELFALRTNGGQEYCGWVLRSALHDLKWRETSEGDVKIVFIAGNEPFTQGPVDYRGICQDAAEKGVVVNAIFCGSEDEGTRTGWSDAASIARGRYLSINHNRRLAYVAAPQDAEIQALNNQLNKTYLAYGQTGGKLQARQALQDEAVAGASREAYMQRAEAKANSSLYRNSSWDLCDAVKDGKSVNDVKKEDLPAEVRDIPSDQRHAYVQNKLREREAIQEKIRKLSAARQEYLRAHATGEDKSLQSAVLQVVHEQAGKRGYTFR